MTQQQFDTQLLEMKRQKSIAVKNIEMMQAEIKEQIANKKRQLHELSETVSKLEQQRSALGQQRIRIEKEWGQRIGDFIRQRPGQGSNLQEADLSNILYELLRRGYKGEISKEDNPQENYKIGKEYTKQYHYDEAAD